MEFDKGLWLTTVKIMEFEISKFTFLKFAYLSRKDFVVSDNKQN